MMIILTALISFLVVFSAFISADILYKKEDSGLKKITKTGWWVLGVDVAIIVLSLIQYWVNKTSEDKRDEKLRKAYTESVTSIVYDLDRNRLQLKSNYDSTTLILKEKYDSSTNELKKSYETSTKNIILSLAAYGLKYDSAEKRIENISKSSSTPDPVFQLVPGDEISFDSSKKHVALNFISSDASSRNFLTKAYLLVELENGIFLYNGYLIPTPKISILSKNQTFSTGFTTNYLVKYLFIWLNGSYSNYFGNKIYPLDIIYRYNYKTKSTDMIKDNYEISIRQKFENELK